MDPTAAYDLHFQEQSMQRKHDLMNRGFLTVEYSGKPEQLPASSKGSQISPRFAEVVVKQLDPRWACKGVTAALLKAAGYSADVAVKTLLGIFLRALAGALRGVGFPTP